MLAMPLWYNTKMITEKLQSWANKGMLTIGDMLDTEGQTYSIEYIQNILQLNCDFLLYNRLKKRIQLVMGNSQILPQDNIRTRLPFILYIIEIGIKGNENTYFNSQATGSNILIELQRKWSKKLNDDVRLDTLSNSFKNAKKYSPSVYQHSIQYKMLHRRIVHSNLLHKMDISATPNCFFLQ